MNVIVRLTFVINSSIAVVDIGMTDSGGMVSLVKRTLKSFY